MNEFEYKRTVDCISYLCGCAVRETTPDIERLSSIDYDQLFAVAEKHMLAAIVGHALNSAGITTNSFKIAIAAAERKAVIFNNDLKNISSEFEKSKIWFMPLKGAILKDYYPRFAMREMCDYDILFDSSRADDVRTIMEWLGFTTNEFGISVVDSYKKPPVSNIEMHRELFGTYHDEKLYNYYRNVKSRLILDEGCSYRYHFSPEDFYVYMVAHEYKHYKYSGTGLRSLLDTYVFIRNTQIDLKYVNSETEKLGINEFERQNRALAIAFFEGSELTSENLNMLDYFLSSGTYGTFKHKMENQIQKDSGNKIRYLIRRIFGPSKYDKGRYRFEKTYAVFYKHKILLPFLPIYRFFRAIKKSPKRIIAEVHNLKKM